MRWWGAGDAQGTALTRDTVHASNAGASCGATGTCTTSSSSLLSAKLGALQHMLEQYDSCMVRLGLCTFLPTPNANSRFCRSGGVAVYSFWGILSNVIRGRRRRAGLVLLSFALQPGSHWRRSSACGSANHAIARGGSVCHHDCQ